MRPRLGLQGDDTPGRTAQWRPELPLDGLPTGAWGCRREEVGSRAAVGHERGVDGVGFLDRTPEVGEDPRQLQVDGFCRVADAVSRSNSPEKPSPNSGSAPGA
ncbi:hypothetical protein GCM10009612_58750 [Streptomyces beijiangensis]